MSFLSGELKEKDVMDMLCCIASKWRALGTQFGFGNNELDEIQMNRHCVAMDCLQDVISRKKERTPFQWTTIVQALYSMKEKKLADRICFKYNIPCFLCKYCILFRSSWHYQSINRCSM